MVDGSRQKNLQEARKRAIHAELTQGVTVRDQNPDDLAESKQLLPLKRILPLGRQIQWAVGCIYPPEHVEELWAGTGRLQGQHLHYKISGISARSLQLQQATSPRLSMPKSMLFAWERELSRRGAPALHQERKTDQHEASWLFCQGCCRIWRASLSSWLKLQLQAAGLSRRGARTSTGVSAFLRFVHLLEPSSVMGQWSLTGELSQGLRAPC